MFSVKISAVNKGFWKKLSFPIVGMSPMDGVTDAACRFIAKKYGMADVTYTEFVSAEGLWRIKQRGEMTHKIWNDLKYSESERPVVAQLFGSDPDSFYKAAKIIVEMGFDGIDINMGCPSPGLEKREGGAGLMRNKDRARAVIEATRKGIMDSGSEIPVSVKTRVGSIEPDPDWWNFLSSMKLPAVAMHGRTFKQLYSGEADWESLSEAAKVIRKSGALFLANGDVKKLYKKEDAVWVELAGGKTRKLDEFDGALIGRQSLGNPWVLKKEIYEPTREEKFKVAIEHAKKHEELFPNNFLSVRKHLASYVKGLPDATELRKKVVMAENSMDVEESFSDG